ncbi:peptidase S41 [Kurthia zopfii]|uniref:Carboxy-terminal processing protease CtpB n=1 Tax=Kurthia zopfii TaxID=1650 RepID=A0A8B4Q9U6_9BACL|nr:S41 family peptidase [Kurthia zopfii]TDR33949.1 carboxyl-terminal processing protease [Kurthia zopfii]GEK31902.1 peptidase S41 [Kurthia zopfii]STX09487.1 Carboxy-terminal processing protease CtpB precursor [Kurthia zopfii]
MDENKKQESKDDSQPQLDNKEQELPRPASKYVKLKPFTLIMMIIVLILGTSGITIFALTVGEKKVVEVRTPNHEEFQKLFNAYDEIGKSYYEEVDQDKLVNGALKGMVNALGDPYSDYMGTEEATQFNDSISSSFDGIGAEIQERDGQIIIVSPIKNSPAEKAGLLPNDIIKSVNGKSIAGLSSTEAVQKIRGKRGTKVDIEYQRGKDAKLHKVTLVRAEIPIETVYSKMSKDKIAHIQITSFADRTYQDLLKELDAMEAKGMKGLVLDVRQNPGGILPTAISIASLFVDTGKNVMQIEYKDGKREVIKAQDGRKVRVPTTVLIDGGSASASEILAAALSESSNVKLIGEKSFGKGTMQTAKSLEDGSTLKYTTGKWLTPDGNWIHKKGIQPDEKVAYPKYASLPFLDASKEMKLNDVSEQVKAAEKMLVALGYNPGKVDGLYDELTAYAVSRFQDNEKIKIDGVLKGKTTLKLMDELRKKIQKDDPMVKEAKKIILKDLK